MGRTINTELEEELNKATYLRDPSRSLWANDVKKVLSEYFPGHDCSSLRIRFYTNRLSPESQVKQIHLCCYWLDSNTYFNIGPSTMTDFEFSALCFCVENGYGRDTTKTLVELLTVAVIDQPFEAPLDKHKRHIKIFAENIEKKGWKGCLHSSTMKDLTVVKIPGAGIKRAIPKSWSVDEIASYMLSTGDLPIPSKAKSIISNSHEVFSKSRNALLVRE